ncbi:Protein ZBED8 [Frankliniella fusca]|uniref:Protein ZBED8 n=1 Tax=Frankliniella fusca TaxID=407009 RepID=A0AAE1HX60_9NEOP|nr:Protein ZBED8 [Frankliniella fusca]
MGARGEIERNGIYCWIEKTSEANILKGKPEAHCKFCDVFIRAHHNDLVVHANSAKHKQAASAIPKYKGSKQGTLLSHGITVKSTMSKVVDMKLAAHVACHSSVKTIDHLSELLRDIAQGSGTALEQLRLHRTKCGKIITKVLAPAMLEELVADVGPHHYSVMVDASTDNTTVKYLAIMIKYYSFEEKKMIVDFLGLVLMDRGTAERVYEIFKEFMALVKLDLSKLFALGTDGGLELCGAHNSLFAYLKRAECPGLVLIKCVCHGLDNCSNTASKKFPSTLEYLLRESRGWFSHSSLRKQQYNDLYMQLTEGDKKPPALVRLASTRWLSWYGAVKAHSAQYSELRELFTRAALADDKCHMAQTLSTLHQDGSHLLYLVFLRPILREIVSINVAFQRSSGDIASVYRDLKSFIFTIAQKVIKPEALRRTQENGMLRLTEVQALQVALQRRENFKPLELISYGEAFWKTATELRLPEEKLRVVQTACAEFLVTFLRELTKKLLSCIEAVEQMRAFTPSIALAERGRPEFRQLPLNLIRDPSFDMELLEAQWCRLGTLKISDICPGEENVENVGTIEFWSGVWSLKNAAGEQQYGSLARYVLYLLTLPLSNAVVERLFSQLTIVKDKIRNKLGKEMLEAILRVRTHLKAHDKCCKNFAPGAKMMEKFNSKTMYGERRRREPENIDEGMTDDPDDPPAFEVEATNLDLEDLDNPAPVPEWEEMFELLAEVDALDL